MNLPEDDGTPRAALDIAGEALRTSCRRTAGGFDRDRDGWRYAPDAYDVLGEAGYAAGTLPQVLRQVAAALATAQSAGQVGIDEGDRFTGDPAAAIAATAEALGRAQAAAERLAAAVDEAQGAIRAAHYLSPQHA